MEQMHTVSAPSIVHDDNHDAASGDQPSGDQPSDADARAEAASATDADARAEAAPATEAPVLEPETPPSTETSPPQALRDGERLFAEWLEVMRQKMNHDHLRVLDLFREIDHNGDGTVTKDELASFLRQCGHPMPQPAIDAVMNVIDSDHNGQVDYQEFAKRVHARFHQSPAAADNNSSSSSSSALAPAQTSAAVATSAVPQPGLDGAAIYERWVEELNERCSQDDRNALLAALQAKDVEGSGSLRRQPFRQVVRTTKPPDLNVRETNAMVSHLDSTNTLHIKYSELPIKWDK
jgi:Ca2+-binding EF-hand superfamily protein